jgi:iron complex transport system permease protein
MFAIKRLTPHHFIFISLILITLISIGCFYDWEHDLIHLRFYRWCGALCGGSLTALAGHSLQRTFQNPLAEGYVLGITGISNVTHALFLLFGTQFLLFSNPLLENNIIANNNVSVMLHVISLTVVFVYGLWLFKQSTQHILLIGIWVGQISGAIITLCFVLLPDLLQKSLFFWWFGDLELYEFPYLLAGFTIPLIYFFINISCNGQANLLYYDEKWLNTLPILNNIAKKQKYVHLWLALIATTVVTITLGSLPMIGMMLPLFLLKIQKQFNIHHQKLSELQLRILIIIWGALWLIIADEIGLRLFNPHNIPIGVLTLLSGFLLVIIRFYFNQKKSTDKLKNTKNIL